MEDGGTAEEVRSEIRCWLDEYWNPERPVREWRSLLVGSGWGCPTWPVEWYGRGLGPRLAAVVNEELTKVGAPGVASGVGMNLAAPTILSHGSDELKRRLLPPLLTGEQTWCQLFSESGNGSDLAGLTTRAVRDGDEWVVTGQKVWNSGAHKAAHGLLLAGTDWDVPKHRGITYFALPMRQPGVEVRPLRQMNGHATFNEVFLTDARVGHHDVVGDVGNGWAVTVTTLAHERNIHTGRIGRAPAEPATGRCAREASEEAAAYYATYSLYPQRAGRADLVQARARDTGRNRDGPGPTARQRGGDTPEGRSPERTARPGGAGRRPPAGPRRIAGEADGLPHRPVGGPRPQHPARRPRHAERAGVPRGWLLAEVLVSVPGQSIAGGADEIQRNILGERVLGLPKEPQVDADVPFREVRTNLRGA